MNEDRLASRYSGRTILAIGAHPDDLEAGIGGSLARLRRCGARVVMAVATIPSQFERRTEEAKHAAEILGCELRLLFCERPRRVEDIKTYELVSALDRLVAELEPAALISHGPRNLHKDHGLVYNASVATQRVGFHDFLCYSPLSCHPVEVPFVSQAFIDITETMETKMKALEAHASQFRCRGIATDGYVQEAMFLGRLAGVRYAEGLEVMRLMLT